MDDNENKIIGEIVIKKINDRTMSDVDEQEAKEFSYLFKKCLKNTQFI